jgi:hypothetical protein
MSKLTPRDVLDLWESTWGPLDDKWRDEFLDHKDMQQILAFEYNRIDECIKKTKKLNRLLRLLESTRRTRVRRTSPQGLSSRHISEYGRVTIKSPGKSEAVLPGRSTCPACGVVVSGNDLRCKCT